MALIDYEKLKEIRRFLHRHPETSGREEKTAEYIKTELEKTGPDRILTGVGGYGVIARYLGEEDGPRIMFRAELDGLPIPETGSRAHRSSEPGKSHACGHDGHMASLLGVARYLGSNRPKSGEVCLLFQPAEETGEGALWMLQDPKLNKLQFDRGYAFHNLPGFDENLLVWREGAFAAASVGLRIILTGATSHAGYPHQGRSPAGAMARFVQYVEAEGRETAGRESFAFSTTIYTRLGEEAFGTTPGEAEIGVTLRASTGELLSEFRAGVEEKARNLAFEYNLKLDIEELEPFAATINDKACLEKVLRGAKQEGFKTKELQQPFPWSEDFGRFSEVSKIALVGLGAGRDHPHLHDSSYDFNDNLIPAAVTLFIQILKEENVI